MLAVAACTHAAQIGGADSNLITRREIESSGSVTAYDAVQKLRGTFLSDRGKTTILGASSSTPVVFLDGIRYGELQSLRNIAASHVATIRLYRAWEAQQKFGTGQMGGVIEVTTRK
jgi:outer membrane cobalamin receptor